MRSAHSESAMRGRIGLVNVVLFLAVSVLGFSSHARGQEPPFVPEGWVLVDDMILPAEVVYGEANWTATPWPSGIVPFDFDFSATPANREAAEDAMAELEAVANIDFVPRTNQGNFIRFVSTNSNSSFVGMIGGRQDINIFNWGFRYIIVHELLHALGFNHEQSRPDRNNFVTINFGNISQTACDGTCNHNFDIDTNATTVGPYDFLSIMHYGRSDFTANGQDTITCQPAFAQFQNQMGQRGFMTTLDAQGLANRYGGPTAPSILALSPGSFTVGNQPVTLTINGTRFFAGSSTNSGVQGSRVRINGVEVPTIYDSPTQLRATVDVSFLDYPEALNITVRNPPEAGGTSNSRLITVNCGLAASVALTVGNSVAISNPCTRFTLIPVLNSWNVVAIASTSDWDVNLGPANSWFGTGTTDFVLANGENGTIFTTQGDFPRFSGNTSAAAEHRAAANLTVGGVADTSVTAGSVFRAFRVQVPSSGSYTVQVTGEPSLFWRLFAPVADTQWRTAGSAIASGSGGAASGTPVTLGSGSHLLVVYLNDGVRANNLPFTASLCTPAASITLASSSTGQGLSNGCQPFNFTQLANRWNVVGITSASDWDIAIGAAESQGGNGQCDFLVADGHAGAITPSSGFFTRFSGSGTGYANFGTTIQSAQPNFASVGNFGTLEAVRIHEFNVASPQRVDFSFTGSANLGWSLYAPTGSAAWRSRGTGLLAGSVNGGSAIGVQLAAGWHALVLHRDGAGGTSEPFSIAVSPTPNPVPTLSSVSPNSAVAGSGATSITVTGTGFVASSVVRLNGVSLATTVVNGTTLNATIPASSLTAVGTRTVSVFTPAPGGGFSNALNFEVVNPLPVLTSIAPTSALAGSAAQTLTLTGSEFAASSVARFNGTNLVTSFGSANSLTATVPANLMVNAGTHAITVFTAAPGGGTSAPRTFTVNNPLPVLASITPASVTTQGPSFTLTLSGSGFNSQSVARLGGTALATTLVSASTLTSTVLASQIATGGTANITVTAPAPGGGTSTARVLTINNPAPIIASITPNSALRGASTTVVAIGGINFVPNSTVQWDLATTLSTTFVSSTNLQATIPSGLLATAGIRMLRVVSPTPGGGQSFGLPFTVNELAPVLASIAPQSVIAGGPSTTLNVTGSAFAAGSIVRLDGTNLTTTFVSASSLSASLPASSIAAPRIGQVTVFTPAPGGGESSPQTLGILRPALLSLTPNTIAPMTAASPPITLTVAGLNLLPGATLHANGEALPTTLVGGSQLQAQITPAIWQTLRPGGITINIQNGVQAVSNTAVLRVGTGSNVGTIRRQPLAPALGEAYSALVEGGLPSAPLSVYIDLENPMPVTGFPDLNANLTLAVGPFAGTGSMFLPLLEGVGIYRPSDGTTLGTDGALAIPGFVVPNPAVGIELTVQGLYLDPAAPFGFRMTWARWPDRL